MSSRKALIVFLLIIVVAGLGLTWELNRRALSEVRVERASLKDLSVKLGWDFGSFPPIPKVEELEVTLLLEVKNPQDYAIELDELTYEIALEGVQLANGSRKGLVINPGKNDLELPLHIKVENITPFLENLIKKIVDSKLKEVKIEYVVKGRITMPLKLFGLRLGSVELPYRHEDSYVLPLTLPMELINVDTCR